MLKNNEDVEVTLDKNEEYESSRREKSVKESYLAIWLLDIIKYGSQIFCLKMS